MEKSQELIIQAKEAKQQKKFTYDDIMNVLTKNGVPAVSLSTVRRVFAPGSEEKASSFNYEETLLPILNAIKDLMGDEEDSPMTKELNAFRGTLELVTAQLKEKDLLIERLIDRLNAKDDIIHQFLADMKQKDIIIQRLMEKCFENSKD